MATYQEQLEKSVSNASKAMVALAELNVIHEALRLLERDGILPPSQRFDLLRAFVGKHPEINKAIRGAYGHGGDTSGQ